jgi:hypothetical protein
MFQILVKTWASGTRDILQLSRNASRSQYRTAPTPRQEVFFIAFPIVKLTVLG